MFDLHELAQADRALNALATGQWKSSQLAPKPQPRQGDIAKCPFQAQTRDLAA